MASKELLDGLTSSGFSESIINQARRKLGLKTKKVGFGDSTWMAFPAGWSEGVNPGGEGFSQTPQTK